ncbi:DNA-binding protein [Emticicia sp. TH156]|uniref:DNA-binding protein n=1 Tax=Emticicia sp. TH156 TaxID=2067454 RepID=UPI000C78B394|nr:DNA-binding protein [Emticicia sp. TH156]PLK44808.1 DNA-binding protein [Emticicia sp. TH156]
MKDLTASSIDRQNILNNTIVLEYLQTNLDVKGMFYKEQYLFTRQQVEEYFEIDKRTTDRYLTQYEEELRQNGYINLKGSSLKDFKTRFKDVLKIDSKTSQLSLFNFRSFLNLGMLLTESEKASRLRSKILDIVIDTLNQKLGGSTKFINQREEDFLAATIQEPLYHKEFTRALNLYLEMGNYKYAYYKDAIYKAIFKEDANEYKSILQLEEKENERNTMYAEVLRLIASFEIGIADAMRDKSIQLNRKLTPEELDVLIGDFTKQRLWIPLLEDVRTKMASRDYGLRNTIHLNLESYINAMSSHDYEKFLGQKSKSLIERVLESPELLDVFKRLKDR